MHKTARTNAKRLLPKWLIYPALGLGLIMHFGTALLRVRVFFPTPALADFSAFYAAAFAVRQGFSPYGLPVEWLAALQAATGIPALPPLIYNPPLWPWLLQPFAVVRYPLAAWVWLLCNLGLLVWVAQSVHKSANDRIDDKRSTRLFFSAVPPLVRVIFLCSVFITFGPVFLDLSLGQTSVVLLGMCFVIGIQLRKRDSWKTAVITGSAVALASIAKLYPALWLAPLVLMRRWKQTGVSLALSALALSAGFVLLPGDNRDYWQRALPQRLASAASQVSMDDQSLVAWLDRLTRPHTYAVPGLDTAERENVVWEPLLELTPRQVQVVGYALSAFIGLPILFFLIKSGQTDDVGKFTMWVLYILMVFPHMERYNHALLLPSMVWLWQRGRQKLVLAAYILTGLSRLNHVWIRFLPHPWGPLASGFGLFAVLALIGGSLLELRQPRPLPGRS